MIYQIIVKLIKIYHHVTIEILKWMIKYDKIKIQINLHKIDVSHSSLFHRVDSKKTNTKTKNKTKTSINTKYYEFWGNFQKLQKQHIYYTQCS